MNDKKILILAQTPPPFHGQAIMQKYLVDVKWDWCKKDFERMNFSGEIDEVGTFRFKKISQLFDLVRRVRKKARPKMDLIYYPPGGPNRVPIYRDIIMLFFLKMASRKIVLHFHAGGIDQIFNKVTRLESYFIKKAFQNVDAVIVLSDWLRKEVEWCRPRKSFVVGNGIQDVFHNFRKKGNTGTISFLFIGNLKKEKGIFTLLDAALILQNRGEKFEIKFIGSFHNGEEERQFSEFIEKKGLTGHIRFLGSRNGNDKWKEFESADIFCLPTYETEAMPISILEAMMFEMPVITTRWRSIPDLIQDDRNGLLFDPQNAEQLASCMQKLMHDEGGRKQMGVQARKDYLQHFTVEQHLRKMELTFQEILVA